MLDVASEMLEAGLDEIDRIDGIDGIEASEMLEIGR
jgi:hypothetical protein